MPSASESESNNRKEKKNQSHKVRMEKTELQIKNISKTILGGELF